MMESTSIVSQAIKLKASERIQIPEQILGSLNVLNPEIDLAWAAESDVRIEAFERGEIETISAREVFAGHGNR